MTDDFEQVLLSVEDLKFEYLVIKARGAESLSERLNAAGDEGWHLHTLIHMPQLGEMWILATMERAL